MNTTDKKQAEIARLKVRASMPQIIKDVIDGNLTKKPTLQNITNNVKKRRFKTMKKHLKITWGLKKMRENGWTLKQVNKKWNETRYMTIAEIKKWIKEGN